ncbi:MULTISPECIES: hypothetical protein [unclassified Microbacterium]|uniref:hypothetical protein n=1 Tax=unclassified Microbacterium TaxID=2609290 RepID=UPI0022F07FD4|nr:hypothetical protein [Streptomyces sp. MS2A]
MKKRRYLATLAVASGLILGVGGTTAATAAPLTLSAASAVDVQVNDRIAIEGVQPHLGGYCKLVQGEGHVSWSVPTVYPPGTRVVAESTDPGREWSSSFAISDGKARLPTYKGSQTTTYRVKFVTPTGTESKESTITYSRPYVGSCGTTFVVNGTGPQNIDYPEAEAIRSVSDGGAGVTDLVMDEGSFQSAAYRYVVRVDGRYAGEVHAGTAYYLPNRKNSDGTRTITVRTDPGARTVEVLIDNTTPGASLSADQQLLVSKVVG